MAALCATMNRAILGSLGTMGGTIVALGGGTLLLTNACLVVGRTISKQQRVTTMRRPSSGHCLCLVPPPCDVQKT